MLDKPGINASRLVFLEEQSEDFKNSTATYQEHQHKDPALGNWELDRLSLRSRLSLFLCVDACKLSVSSSLPCGLVSL